MNKKFYLVISQKGKVRATKTSPSLEWNEISIGVNLDIPDAIFERPILNASITIPTDTVIKTPINAEVRDNVAEAIKQATGLKFVIKIEEDVIDKLEKGQK